MLMSCYNTVLLCACNSAKYVEYFSAKEWMDGKWGVGLPTVYPSQIVCYKMFILLYLHYKKVLPMQTYYAVVYVS